MEKVVTPAQNNEHKETMDAAKIAELKAKKAESAKAWKERKDKEAAERVETTKGLIKFLADKKVELPEQYAKLLNDIVNPVKRSSGSSNNGLFVKLFGAEPKVGDSVTLIDAFRKTLSDKAKIDRYVKQWAEKGVIVEFKAEADMLKSTYTIVKLA